MNSEQETPKFTAFVAELEALCHKHGVHLCSSGYDGLQVWDDDGFDGALTSAGIDDCTKAPT